MNNTICFIPVRKGSKGIPGKNMKMLGEKPLICWIVDTVLLSGIADTVWVATDWDEMEKLIGQRYENRVNVFRRSAWSARDESPTMDVVSEFLNQQIVDDSDYFVLLQATSPFISVDDLLLLKQEMEQNIYDSFVSCYRLKGFRWSEEGLPLDYTFQSKPRRQDYKGWLIESGGFYASTSGEIKKSGILLPGQVKVIESGEESMIDIDEERDWKIAELYIQNKWI